MGGLLLGVGAVLVTATNMLFYGRPLRKLWQAFAAAPDRYPQNPSTPGEDAQGVSVVLAARNEAANLTAHLPQVLAQAYAHEWEVVVANDHSTDATPEVIEQLKEHNPHLHLAPPQNAGAIGKKAALTRSILHARHDWLLATDADAWPASPHWLATMMDHRRIDTEIVLGYAPYPRERGSINLWLRFETVYTAAQYLAAALLGRPYMGVGRNLLYRRAAFARAGGFARHAHVVGGDDDLLVNAIATPANTVVCVDAAAWMYSTPKRSWGDYFRQKRRHIGVGSKYKTRDLLWLNSLAASHGLHYVALLALLTTGQWPLALLLGGARATYVWPRMGRTLRLMGAADLRRYWPLLDAGLCVYYVYGASVALRGSATRWS